MLLSFNNFSGQAVANSQETPKSLSLMHPGQDQPYDAAAAAAPYGAALPAEVVSVLL